MIQIFLFYIVVARTQKLIRSFELNAYNQISGIINAEENNSNILIVFYFENADNPIALVSKEEIFDTDFNITVKPIFIESQKSLLFDYESIQTHGHTHMIELQQIENIYYYAKVRFGVFKLKIEVYQKPHSSCINNCQGFQISKIKQHSYCNTKCECEFGFFGSYCQFELLNIEKDTFYKINLITHKVVYLSFKFDQEAILIADDVIDPITVSFGILGIKGFEIPDQTSYTAILHRQLSITKLMQNLQFQYKNVSTLIIGMQCRRDQNISIILKQDKSTAIWNGNCMFLAFASFNIILIVMCFGVTNFCKEKKVIIKKKRKIKVRPPILEKDPKNFSGSFFNKYFEIYNYEDFIQMNPQFRQNAQCVVCMEELNQKEISITPCNHTFHHQCLKKWLMRTLNCPSCRFSISYQQVIEGGWFGSKISQNQISQKQNSKSHLMINRCNSLIENNENTENIVMVEKVDEN